MEATLTKQFKIEECYTCGVLMGFTESFQKELLSTKRPFYCPNGHGQSYAKSTTEKLREQIAEKEELIKDLLTRNTALSIERDILEKEQKRKKRR